MAPGAHREDGTPVRFPEDLAMVRRAREGDRDARETLVSRMGCVRSFLSGWNARWGRPLGPDELEDAVQNTLLAAWSKLDAFTGSGALEAWLHRFSHLELLAYLRQVRRAGRLLEEDPGPGPVDESVPSDPLELERLYRSLDRLDDSVAEVIRLHHFDDLTFEETARRLGVPTNTAKTRYYRGLRRLRTLLGGNARKAAAPLEERP